MSMKDRKAGYQAGLMTAGDWMKGRMVGLIMRGNIVLRKDVKLKDDQYLFVATKEELEELMKGEVPK